MPPKDMDKQAPMERSPTLWLNSPDIQAQLCMSPDRGCDKWPTTWNSCGGSQFAPCGTVHADSQWPKTCCSTNDVCVRQSSTWWRCEPRSGACWNNVPTWSTCGGKIGCPGGGSTCDSPWKGYCCKTGDVCARQSVDWWRCEPADYYAGHSVCTRTAGRWNSCGGNGYCPQGTANCDAPWPSTCCQRGESCNRVSADFWRCEPNGQATPDQPPRGSPPPPLAVWAPRLVNANTGETIKINGLNYFGYNVARTMVDGLNNGGPDVASDFTTIAYELRMLGYNAVRLPFRWRDLDAVPKDYSGYCQKTSEQDLRQRLLEPGRWTSKQLPANKAPMTQKWSGGCNTNIPNTDTYERMMWTIQVFISQGIYVILDYQPMGTENQAYDLQEFVCKWTTLWSKVAALPNFSTDIKGRVFVDVMNEPDSMGINWEWSGSKPGARQLYLSSMDAINAITPGGAPFILEGTGQNSFGLNWGNGFVVDKTIIRQYGLGDPNDFFQELITKPYVNQVVFTPHLYPPSVTKATFLGTALWSQSAISFGHLYNQGYCHKQKCTRFAVVIGETGSFLTDWNDKQWMLDFSDFINAGGGATAYTYTQAAGWLWWTYNENSHDTGGIVYDNWQKLNWDKIKFMVSKFWLTPWYLK